MEFRQLEALTQVIRHGSFSKAADDLFLTQPTISTHISSLEKELGLTLIIRAAKEVYPTEAGKIIYDYALDMLALRDAAIAGCRKQTAEPGGQIFIAASTIPYKHVLPELMSAFRARYRQAVFSVLSCDSGGVIQAIEAGTAELGLTGTSSSSSKCVYEDFMDDPLVVVTPNDGPYRAKGDDISVGELVKFPFIVREKGSGTRKEAESYMKKHGFNPESLHIAAQLDDPDAVIKSVGQGLGVSILSRLSAIDCELLGQVKICTLNGETIPRSLYFVRHAKRQLSPVAEAFLHFSLNHVGK